MHERESLHDACQDQRRDRNGGLPTRIDPRTGKEQVQLEGLLGSYWQERDRVTIDPYGMHIDWEA